MENINNPHDLYFRSSMSDLRVAKDFFEHHLPATIIQEVNLSSLQLQNSSFIDTNLRESVVDVLYAVNFNDEPGYLYVVVEHQRKPQKLMAHRVLNYMLRIVDHHINTHNTTILPIVYPIVFYNGSKPYPYSTDLFSLYGKKKD